MDPAILAILARAVALAAVLLVFAPAHDASAQQASGQAAIVPGAQGAKLTPTATARPNNTGLSLAGTKASSTKTPAQEVYAISDLFLASRAPGPPGGGANELAMMQFVIPLIDALVPLAAPPATPAQRKAAEAAFAAGALNAFKQTNPVPPARVGDFTRIGKGKLDTGTAAVRIDGGAEKGSAEAIQDAVKKPGTLDTTGTFATASAIGIPNLGSQKASAYAVNIDPTAVDWTSLSNRSVTLDLTGIQLQALTSGPNSTATATDNFVGAFRDGTTDVTLPQDGASDLFGLSLGVFDAADAAASGLVDLSYLGFSPINDPGNLQIMDSEGGVGLTSVAKDLAASFVAQGSGIFEIENIIDPADPFTITMTVPGSAPSSVLYFDEIGGAGAQVMPEPSGAALLASALLSLCVLWYRRERKNGGCIYHLSLINRRPS